MEENLTENHIEGSTEFSEHCISKVLDDEVKKLSDTKVSEFQKNDEPCVPIHQCVTRGVLFANKCVLKQHDQYLRVDNDQPLLHKEAHHTKSSTHVVNQNCKRIYENRNTGVLSNITPDSNNIYDGNIQTRVPERSSKGIRNSLISKRNDDNAHSLRNHSIKANSIDISRNTNENQPHLPSQNDLPINEALTSFGKEHDKKDGKRTLYQCSRCVNFYSSLLLLNRHFKTHLPLKEDIKPDEEKEVKCDACLDRFLNSEELKVHWSEVHFPFKCDSCEKSFPREDVLCFHLKVEHNLESPYKCEVCAKCFTSRNGLSRHACLSKCEKCGKLLTLKILDRHDCTKVTDSYNCEDCGKRFKQRNNLLIHRRVFVCDECGKCAKLRNIACSVHSQFTCDYCKIVCCSKAGLVVHIKTRHKPEYYRYSLEELEECQLVRARKKEERAIRKAEKVNGIDAIEKKEMEKKKAREKAIAKYRRMNPTQKEEYARKRAEMYRLKKQTLKQIDLIQKHERAGKRLEKNRFKKFGKFVPEKILGKIKNNVPVSIVQTDKRSLFKCEVCGNLYSTVTMLKGHTATHATQPTELIT